MNFAAKHCDLDSNSLNVACTVANDYLQYTNRCSIVDVGRALLANSLVVPVLLIESSAAISRHRCWQRWL